MRDDGQPSRLAVAEVDTTEAALEEALDEPDYCHIGAVGEVRALCGIPAAEVNSPNHHPGIYWNGEAVCSQCRRPICERCRELETLGMSG